MCIQCSIYIHQIWFVNCVIHTAKISFYLYNDFDDMKSVFERSLLKGFDYNCGFIKFYMSATWKIVSKDHK